MLDTSHWPTRTLHVITDLHLDPQNVRLESADSSVEADIMEDIFANEDALSLVEGICKIGYLTHEIPVAVKRDEQFVVVEGNRRLAALKAIQNPLLVPEFRARIDALTSGLPNRAGLETIDVLIAPDDEQANQLIAAIHTGNLRKPWSPARQAAFFQTQIDSGRSLQELKTRYPMLDVEKFVFRAQFVNLFKMVPYENPELSDFVASRKWTRITSTLARIYESKEFLSLTGLRMDNSGHLTTDLDGQSFKKLASTIVSGLQSGDLNTRTLNSTNSPKFKELMAEVRTIAEAAPRTDDKPETDVSTGINDSSQAPTPDQSTSTYGTASSKSSGPETGNATDKKLEKREKQPRKRVRRRLEAGHLTIPESYPEALKVLFHELTQLDARKHPNITFLAIRAVLEKSIKAFSDSLEVEIRETGHNLQGRVQLGNAMDWLLEHLTQTGQSQLAQVVRATKTGQLVTYTSTTDSLNAVNHNHLFRVDADQVFAMWSSIDPIMQYLYKS